MVLSRNLEFRGQTLLRYGVELLGQRRVINLVDHPEITIESLSMLEGGATTAGPPGKHQE